MSIEKELNKLTREMGIRIFEKHELGFPESADAHESHMCPPKCPDFEIMKCSDFYLMPREEFSDKFLRRTETRESSIFEREFNARYNRVTGKIRHLRSVINTLESESLRERLGSEYSEVRSIELLGYVFSDLKRAMMREYVKLRMQNVNEPEAFESSVAPLYSIINQVRRSNIEYNPLGFLLNSYICQMEIAREISKPMKRHGARFM